MANEDRGFETLSGWGMAIVTSFSGAGQALEALCARQCGAPWPTRAGAVAGTGPWLAWRRPGQCVLIALRQADLAAPLAAADALPAETGTMVDCSEATAVHRLSSPRLIDVLARVVDIEALPPPGHATRLRWVDVPVLLWRRDDNEALLLAERSLSGYLSKWWAYASDRVASVPT